VQAADVQRRGILQTYLFSAIIEGGQMSGWGGGGDCPVFPDCRLKFYITEIEKFEFFCEK